MARHMVRFVQIDVARRSVLIHGVRLGSIRGGDRALRGRPSQCRLARCAALGADEPTAGRLRGHKSGRSSGLGAGVLSEVVLRIRSGLVTR